MDRITAGEAEKYQAMWGSVEAYSANSPGNDLADLFMEMNGLAPGCGRTVLDAGCGSGAGALKLRNLGLKVAMVDVTDEGLKAGRIAALPDDEMPPFFKRPLWEDLGDIAFKAGLDGTMFDYVYCCDVMEHIPTEHVMLVAVRLLDVCSNRAFFSISLVPDTFGAWIGQPLHLTVRPFTWWRDRLNMVGRVVECRDFIDSGIFLVEKR